MPSSPWPGDTASQAAMRRRLFTTPVCPTAGGVAASRLGPLLEGGGSQEECAGTHLHLRLSFPSACMLEPRLEVTQT